jgi:hypothetical protein
MGYYKYFTLGIDGFDTQEKLVECIEKLIEMHPSEIGACITDDGCTNGEDATWDNQDDDMKAFSLLYPGIRFRLYCEASDGEQWLDYYINGKHQYSPGTLTYEPYDESKLR